MPYWYAEWHPTGIAVQIPLWLILIAAMLPYATVKLARHFKRNPNACRHCGYDLTGNVSRICSECGHAIEPI